MAILIPPAGNTRVVKRAKSSWGNGGKWHFVRDDHQRKCLCGELISHYFDVEYSTLEKVKAADICAACWPFEKKDAIAANDKQMTLFEAEPKEDSLTTLEDVWKASGGKSI